ncbi:hypothetical protein Bca4012_057676 [Brassica carinata]|uniref:Uncharacterized protein n=1 Tax=Brassica carinata TaxID=52824 RepID=A0A8X8B5A6_BRACI|nr:hypothetical protein Bca52824_014975 [Brassica carinata]
MKKPSLTSFLIAFLLAAAVCTHGEEEEVKDSNGNPVKIYTKYFIKVVETESNMGGGLIPSPIRNPTCPFGITQTINPYQPVTPVSFEYPYISKLTFNTSSYINIRIRPELWAWCTDYSTLWAVDFSSPAAKEPAIIISGRPGSPESAFKIEKATKAHTYKLTTLFGTVGTIPSPFFHEPHLIATNDEAKTLIVEFVKVGDVTTATTTTTTSPVEKLGLRMFPFH